MPVKKKLTRKQETRMNKAEMAMAYMELQKFQKEAVDRAHSLEILLRVYSRATDKYFGRPLPDMLLAQLDTALRQGYARVNKTGENLDITFIIDTAVEKFKETENV